jgi:hypothetical protein
MLGDGIAGPIGMGRDRERARSAMTAVSRRRLVRHGRRNTDAIPGGCEVNTYPEFESCLLRQPVSLHGRVSAQRRRKPYCCGRFRGQSPLENASMGNAGALVRPFSLPGSLVVGFADPMLTLAVALVRL